MDTVIRPLHSDEIIELERFLYHAVFVPEGVEPPPFSIVQAPELQVYLRNFGTQPDDIALAAERYGEIVGAVWARIMDDYGHLDAETPSLAISLLPGFRGSGIGTALLYSLLAQLRERGYARVSLAVQKKNYAVRMYRALGFETVRETDEEFIMVHCLAE